MTTWMQPYDDWAARNESIGCFGSSDEMAAYYVAWRLNDYWTVSDRLERVLAGKFRACSVNWLAFPDLMERVDRCEDGPRKLPEEWSDGDFVVRIGNEAASPAWLAPSGTVSASRWEAGVMEVAKSLLPMPAAQKVRELRRLAADCMEVAGRRPASLDDLFRAASQALFLQWSSPGTPRLYEMAPAAQYAVDQAPGLVSRTQELAGLWWEVTRSPARPLTLSPLRTAGSVWRLRDCLAAAQGERNANILTFLRCEALPVAALPA